MSTKLKIKITDDSEEIEINSSPFDLMVELTAFFTKHKHIAFIMKNAIKMAEVSEREIDKKKKTGYFDHDNKEGEQIMNEFVKGCEDLFAKKN